MEHPVLFFFILFILIFIVQFTVAYPEAVDIKIYDKRDRIVVIEVKFIFESEYYVDSGKQQYPYTRFRDGYEQLEKYFKNIIEQDLGNLNGGYLYMFYAHSNVSRLEEKKKEYLDEVVSNVSLKFFNQYYYDTILHDVLAS